MGVNNNFLGGGGPKILEVQKMQPPTPTNFRGGGILDGQNSANVINGKPLMVKFSNIRKTSTQPQRRPGWLQLVVQWSTLS